MYKIERDVVLYNISLGHKICSFHIIFLLLVWLLSRDQLLPDILTEDPISRVTKAVIKTDDLRYKMTDILKQLWNIN